MPSGESGGVRTVAQKLVLAKHVHLNDEWVALSRDIAQGFDEPTCPFPSRLIVPVVDRSFRNSDSAQLRVRIPDLPGLPSDWVGRPEGGRNVEALSHEHGYGTG